MKSLKIFLAFTLMALVLSTVSVSAQFVERKAKDSTIIGTKYITFTQVKKGTTGFQLTAVKDSGTVAGTVTLERRIDPSPSAGTSVWKQVGSQSFTLTNITAPQGDIFPITIQDGVSYRFKIVATGGKAYLYASYVRY